MDIGYDEAGRLKSMTQPRGATTFAYDPATGKPASSTAPGGERISYDFDGALPTRWTFAGSTTGAVSRTYDGDFRVASETVSGGTPTTFSYEQDGLLSNAGELALTRDAQHGLLSTMTLGSIATTITRNGFGEPATVATADGAAPLYSESFERDDLGRITAKTETRGGETRTYGYTYDAANRLERVTRNGIQQASYSYDPNGNRTQVTRGAGLPIIATYDEQDRLTRAGIHEYAYTDAGELRSKRDTSAAATTTYDYDAMGALTGVTLPGATRLDYVIDPNGRRVAKKRNGAVVQSFRYGAGLAPLAELNPDGTVLSQFVYATRPNVPEYMLRGGQRYRIVTDHLGSPRVVVNADTGAVAQEIEYDEFGRVTSDTNPGFQPFGFAGGLYDRDTKLVRFGARDYDPETGRFTAKDPIDFAGGDTNLYSYVAQDPVNLVDPSGLFLDTFLDVAFVAYDIYKIGKGLANGCGVSGTDLAALGADLAMAAVPFGTGGGVAVRAGAKAGGDSKLVRNVCNCFPAGTPVKTENGSRPIERIRVGDRVWARNLSTGRQQLRRVTGLFSKRADSMLTLHAGRLRIEVTPGHPFWVRQRGWVQSQRLAVGDNLLTFDGRSVSIDAIETRSAATTVYNFEVAGDHNYFISDAQLLVHNCTVPRFHGPNKPWPTGATPNSIYTHLDPVTGVPKQNAIYDANGDVIAHVDFKQHGSSPPGHFHTFPAPGNPSSGHGRGNPHYPPESLPPGWGDVP